MAPVTVMAVLAGLADFVGGWFTLGLAFSRERVEQLIAVGAGFMLGGALFTMLPGALEATPRGTLYVALGYLGLFAIRLASHAGHEPHGPDRSSAGVAVAALSVHSFFDGAALGAASLLDARLGLMALVAIFLHKLPEGFSLAALVLAATRSRPYALGATALIGLATLLGGWSALAWAHVTNISHGALLGLAAGSFLYIGATDMLPDVMRKGKTAWLVPLGMALIYLVTGGGHAH